MLKVNPQVTDGTAEPVWTHDLAPDPN